MPVATGLLQLDLRRVTRVEVAGRVRSRAVAKLHEARSLAVERLRRPPSREVGGYLLAALRDRLADMPIVGDIRGRGLLLAVELVSDKATRAPLQFKRQALADRIRIEHAVIVRSIGANIIIAPPLILERAEADTIANALAQVIGTTNADGTTKA